VSAEARLAETRHAFDAVADAYDGPLGNNEIVRRMRAELLAAVERWIPAPARLLDLGCGTGIDAAHLAARAYRVTAVDAAPGMVARTRARAAREGLGDRVTARELPLEALGTLAGAAFDGAYSDLGALNCAADLAGVAASCAAALRPGGVLVASVIGRLCPWELAYYFARGELRRARVRFAAGAVPVPLAGGTVWTRYYRPQEFLAAFRPAFVCVARRALGLLSPPPYLVGFHRRLPRTSRALARLDRWFGRLPLAREAGDHFLVVLRRHV